MEKIQYQYIELHQDGVKAIILLNRPDVLNALNQAMVEEVLDAMGRISPGTRVLTLRGAGNRAFAAGADITELEKRTAGTEMLQGSRRMLAERLENAPYLTIAAINGIALGGGLELALACNLRIASERAKLGLPETKLGIIPGNGGTVRLTRLIGSARALQLMLLGETLSADEALRLGVVNWVVSEQDFNGQVEALTDRLSRLSPVASRAVVDCVISSAGVPQERAIAYEQRWFQICLESPDKREGVRAFLEKRPPDFSA